MNKNEKLERAKTLLIAFEEAMSHADVICETVHDWVAGEDPPPLLRSSHTWREAVDPERLKQFETLVFFLSEALFGVDCDYDSALKVVLIDKARDLRRPGLRIPRISDRPSLKEIFGSLRRAKTEAKIAQGIVEQVEQELEFFLEDNPEIFEKKGKLE